MEKTLCVISKSYFFAFLISASFATAAMISSHISRESRIEPVSPNSFFLSSSAFRTGP